MKKKALASAIAAGLLCAAGLASAAEPMQLTESQMDSVSAGGQSSVAYGTASAWYGTAYVKVSTSAYQNGGLRTTRASALSVATGFGASAHSSAASTF